MATPNMNLTLPIVGVTAGPAYASQINAALTVVDGHDHTSGSGAQITPAALNINADLTIGSNNLTDARTVRFTAQGAALTGASPDLACMYVVGDNLYYNDGIGNQIAITSSGSIAGAAGNITGLVAPASVTFTGGGSPNYKFMSTATVSANLDAASLIMRNPGVTATYSLTVQAPTLASNYSITLPAAPAAPAFLQMDSSGIITAAPALALGITSANLAADSVTTSKIVDDAVTLAKLGFIVSQGTVTTNFTANGNLVIPANVTQIVIQACGGGGGGGGGYLGAVGSNGGGAAGGGGAPVIILTRPVTGGETLAIAIGAGGIAGQTPSGTGLTGGTGGDSIVTGTFGSIYFPGAAGGAGGSVGGGGAPASAILNAYISATGGAGGPAASVGVAGARTVLSAGGATGALGAAGAGGGGGASLGAGGAGGNGATNVFGGIATAGGAGGYGAGGGGGGGGSASNFGVLGGVGGPGYVEITYVTAV